MLGKCWNRLNRPLHDDLEYSFIQAFNIFYVFNNVGRSVQTHRTFGSTKCWMQVDAGVETV